MKVISLSLLFIGLLPASLVAQEVVEISREQVCQDCTISLEHLATLGKIADPISPRWWASVAIDRSGDFYVGPTTSISEIAVYGPTGEFLRVLGRRGEGPGEFKGIRALRITGGDTLHVFSLPRHTVMSTSGEVFETSPFLLSPWDAFILGDGRVLALDYINTPASFGLPAHIIGPGGRPIQSFGNNPQGPTRVVPGGGIRTVSVSGGNRVWINPAGAYRLELWDTAGVHLRTLVREAPWFEPWEVDPPGRPFKVKPNPTILSVHQDRRGLVWVFGQVPDHNWQPTSEPPAYEDVYDTIVEVIDPSSGELIISRRFEGRLHRFLGFFSEDLVRSSSVGELGLELVHVWRMQLVRPRENRRDP